MTCLTCCYLFAFSTLITQSEPHNHYVPHCRAITLNSPFVSKYFSEHFVFYSYNLYCNNIFFIYSPTSKGYIQYIFTASQTCGHYTGCPRRKGPNFGRVFLRSNYTDITQNTYIQSSMVTEILAREV